MKIHCDYVVSASAGEEIRNQRAGLGNPLTVANLGLKGRWLCGRLSYETAKSNVAIYAGLAIRSRGLIRLVGVDSLTALDAILLDRARRVWMATGALVHLHATELVVEGRGAVS